MVSFEYRITHAKNSIEKDDFSDGFRRFLLLCEEKVERFRRFKGIMFTIPPFKARNIN